MSSVQDFLLEIEKISDPKERLSKLEESEFRDEDSVKTAIAWWHARYYFTNRKKTHAADRFLWYLLIVSQTSMMSASSRRLISDYKKAFLSPEIEKAMALDDRLEKELLSACTLYIETINVNTGILGFTVGKPLSKDETMARIANIVALRFMPVVYSLCSRLKYSDIVARCLWKGAEQAYPGISDALESHVRKYDDGFMRDFVLNAVSD